MERLKPIALYPQSDSFIKSICSQIKESLSYGKWPKKLPAHFCKIVQECLAHPTPQLFPSIVNIWAQYS